MLIKIIKPAKICKIQDMSSGERKSPCDICEEKYCFYRIEFTLNIIQLIDHRTNYRIVFVCHKLECLEYLKLLAC